MFKVGDRVKSEVFGEGTVTVGGFDTMIVSFDSPNKALWGKNSYVFKSNGQHIGGGCEAYGGVVPAYREVKRKAKVGEWVKIVKVMPFHKAFDIGDICEVLNTPIYGSYTRIKTKRESSFYDESSLGNPQPFSLINDDEYVVLEGYEPPKPKESEITAFWQDERTEKPKEKHKYTKKQIEEARGLAHHLLCNGFDEGKSFEFKKTLDGACYVNVYFNLNGENTGRRFWARCRKNDEFNTVIGKMILLCRAMNHPIPKWVTEHDKV